jgi:hypothetical protein
MPLKRAEVYGSERARRSWWWHAVPICFSVVYYVLCVLCRVVCLNRWLVSVYLCVV